MIAPYVVALSWFVAAAGVVMAAAVLALTRRLLPAVQMLLDLLLAAGLVRLSADAPWGSIAAAAAIVVLRKLVTAGLRQAGVAECGVALRAPDVG